MTQKIWMSIPMAPVTIGKTMSAHSCAICTVELTLRIHPTPLLTVVITLTPKKTDLEGEEGSCTEISRGGQTVCVSNMVTGLGFP